MRIEQVYANCLAVAAISERGPVFPIFKLKEEREKILLNKVTLIQPSGLFVEIRGFMGENTWFFVKKRDLPDASGLLAQIKTSKNQ